MRNGMDPGEAANDAISRIVKIYPNFVGAIIAMDKYGNHGMSYTKKLDDCHWSWAYSDIFF